MSSLNEYVFTSGSDEARADDGLINNVNSVVESLSGDDTFIATQGFDELYRSWGVWNQGAISMDAGNDAIFGNISLPGVQASYGVLNDGSVDTGTGDDSIVGHSDNPSGRYAYGLFNHGSISLGSGSDLLSGTAISDTDEFNVGIFNVQESLIDTGAGSDIVRGESGQLLDNNYGLLNYGSISTGIGNDLVEATGVLSAIFNPGVIETGDGCDTLNALSYDRTGVNANASLDNYYKIDMGRGADSIFCSGSRFGLMNNGTLLLGEGHDQLKAVSVFVNGAAIVNSGSIDMGSGNDSVDAITGGFEGSGTIDLGSGKDSLLGYGNGRFIGGIGIDVITLPSGTYGIADNLDGSYIVGGAMIVSGFECFGSGANVSSFLVAAESGSVSFV